MMKCDFPVRFFELRKACGLTQEEIGDKLGVSRGAISFYENGDREPNKEFVLRAAEFFHVTTDWLIGREGAVKSYDIPEDGGYRRLYLLEKERRENAERAFDLLMESLRNIVDRCCTGRPQLEDCGSGRKVNFSSKK